MKTDSEPKSAGVGRRTWLGGAASVGALVAGSMVVAQRNTVSALAANADTAGQSSEPATGYQLTEHVKRYYATARV